MPVSDARANLADMELIAQAARQGGATAMSYFRKDPHRWTKDNDSPVSEADLAVDRQLAEILQAARPDYGWLSEETADDSSRLNSARSFVVDPIDGTRGFLSGSPEWTVAIAVVEAGRPVAAALYQPVTDHLYTAAPGHGATCNGAPLRISDRASLNGASAAGPKAITSRDRLRDMGIRPAGYVPSLALRLAILAAGRIDLAVVRENACDWDLAASDLLVQEAGGRLEDLRGRPLSYNRGSVRHPALLGGPKALVDPLRPILAELM
ncbi:3'(2'),5'-bisphosphate nucleotidase CysQ [Stappia sp. ES.058]|uniref:3'(2'),5'-bisphosphate nucleotidase CysQ n=1 Tax=Stappia sp. ES.058 TaxID=1881061 RepID=UPI00087BD761|nr:3'(2'),5'-bisphosphate nucleotidase CysQ [Stappia sp. ES.058]SDT91761.1 myo-inositol-1(or 4)-monophosphatase [Stappia sp. ES.058]